MATRLQAGDIWLDGEGGKWIGMPVSTLRRPHAGRLVKAPASWLVVTKGACAWAVFYKTYGSPQCNTNPDVVAAVLARSTFKELSPLGYHIEVRDLGFTFTPHNCGDYC